VTQTHYFDQNGSPTPGEDGAFTKQSKYNRFGRPIESTSLWKDGRPMNDKAGSAGARFSYDDLGNVVSVETIDAAGNPTELNKNHIYRTVVKYDERGNAVETSLRHANGDSNLIAGVCKLVRNSFDEHGNGVEGYCVRQDGELATIGWAVTKNKFDDD